MKIIYEPINITPKKSLINRIKDFFDTYTKSIRNIAIGVGLGILEFVFLLTKAPEWVINVYSLFILATLSYAVGLDEIKGFFIGLLEISVGIGKSLLIIGLLYLLLNLPINVLLILIIILLILITLLLIRRHGG